MNALFKIPLVSLFLIGSQVCLAETSTTFSYSKEKGIQPLEASKNTVQPGLKSPSAKVMSSILIEEGQTPLVKIQTKENTEHVIPEHSISEDFAPDLKAGVQGINIWDTLLEDVSWVFQKKKTSHKITFVPVYSYNSSQGALLGLRFFAYSPDPKGYHFSASGSKYWSQPFFRWKISHIGSRKERIRTESTFIYDNHDDDYFGQSMHSKLSDVIKLSARHLLASHKIFYQLQKPNFYIGLDTQLLFRKENPAFQDGKTYFEQEFFWFLSLLAGYDSRNNWKDATKGVFHQLAFGCKSIVAYPGAYCRGEGDFRFYISMFEDMLVHKSIRNSLFAFRFFMGSSFLSSGTYSTNYSLGGINFVQGTNFMRGFRFNRFRGNKIYLAQSEYRFLIWKKYLQGALFLELGETTGYKESFGHFVVDYGGGLRIGFPPKYDTKLRFDFGTGTDLQGKRNNNFEISFFQVF